MWLVLIAPTKLNDTIGKPDPFQLNIHSSLRCTVYSHDRAFLIVDHEIPSPKYFHVDCLPSGMERIKSRRHVSGEVSYPKTFHHAPRAND